MFLCFASAAISFPIPVWGFLVLTTRLPNCYFNEMLNMESTIETLTSIDSSRRQRLLLHHAFQTIPRLTKMACGKPCIIFLPQPTSEKIGQCACQKSPPFIRRLAHYNRQPPAKVNYCCIFGNRITNARIKTSQPE